MALEILFSGISYLVGALSPLLFYNTIQFNFTYVYSLEGFFSSRLLYEFFKFSLVLIVPLHIRFFILLFHPPTYLIFLSSFSIISPNTIFYLLLQRRSASPSLTGYLISLVIWIVACIKSFKANIHIYKLLSIKF